MMKVFIDTGALYALVDQDDVKHNDACRVWEKLLTENIPLISTILVVSETYTLIRYKLGHTQAIEFLNTISEAEQSKHIDTRLLNEELIKHACTILHKYADHRLSYTDAVSLALIELEEIGYSFDFDYHFRLSSALPVDSVP
jgi:predicted nucleic acid-binding protein